MRRLLVICAALSLLGVHAALSDAALPERPNVLFIAIDDLNDWVGILGGHPQAHTPNLDRLAGRGLAFTNAHTVAPACNPSRTALLTGIHPSTSGVYYNGQDWRSALPDAVTLPQYFMANGYRTIGAGKIFHGDPDPRSWHEYFPSRERNKPDDPYPEEAPLNELFMAMNFDWGPVQVDDTKMGDAQVVSWAIEQLAKPQTEPFFLATGIYRPHLPWYVPQEYFEPYPLDEIQLPPVVEDDLDDVPDAASAFTSSWDHSRVVDSGQWKAAVQGYLASIAFADAQLGRLIDAFEASRYADNTIVVLWSDHGWHLGEKEHWRKFTLWERATRTPLVVIAPGLTEPAMRTSKPVSLLDLYPTLVDLAGLPPREELQGQSLRPLLEDVEANWTRPALTTHGPGNHSLRSERYRYTRYADGSEELYDHDSDPNEWTNVASDPDLEGVKVELAAWFPKQDAPSEGVMWLYLRQLLRLLFKW